MAIRQNIGTGGLYPTGIAPQALDFRASQEAMSQALINQSKQRIQQEKDYMNESEKAILNSLSFEAVQGLSDQVQQNHLKNYNELTDKWTNIYKERGGKLSDFDQLALKKDKMKLDSETANLKSNVEQFRFAQKEIMAHPFLYDPESVKRLTDVSTKGLVGLPESANVLVPLARTPLDYITNIHKDELSKLAKQTDTEISMARSRQGIVSALKDNERRLGDWYDVKVKENPGLFGRISKEDFVKAEKTNYNTESFSGSLYSTDRRSSGADKNAINYTPTPFEHKGSGTKYNIVQIPSNVSKADQNFFINKAVNKDTGEIVQLDQNKASLLGVDVDKGVILLEGLGAKAERGGKQLFIKEGVPPAKDDEGWEGDTEEQLSNPARQEQIIKNNFPAGTTIKEVKDTKTVKNKDGSITVSGTATINPGMFSRNIKENVKVTLNTFNDPKAQAVFEAPLGVNKPAVAVAFPKVKVRGVPLEQYVDEAGQNKSINPANIATIEEAVSYLRMLPKYKDKTDDELRAIAEAHKK
jgi:hypothetical protein